LSYKPNTPRLFGFELNLSIFGQSGLQEASVVQLLNMP